VLGVLVLIRRTDRVHLEAAGIEGPAEPADDTAFAGGIPSLEDDERPFRGPQIGLLNELQRALQRRETPLVIGEIHFRVRLDRRETRPARDDEAPGLHDVDRSKARWCCPASFKRTLATADFGTRKPQQPL
jgi:hypothetical protein